LYTSAIVLEDKSQLQLKQNESQDLELARKIMLWWMVIRESLGLFRPIHTVPSDVILECSVGLSSTMRDTAKIMTRSAMTFSERNLLVLEMYNQAIVISFCSLAGLNNSHCGANL
jgi:hypothetical protein